MNTTPHRFGGVFLYQKGKDKMKKKDIQMIAKHWAIEPTAIQGVNATFREAQAGLSLFAQKPLANTHTATIRDGVAVIPIHGVITPRADVFTFLMGGTALDLLAKDLQAALDNPDVKSILLDVDSPGGVAVGPSETAEIIHRAGDWKPVWAYVGRNCCSAAYWLASAATKIVAEKTALLGSIGVVSSISVQEKPDADGYKQIEVVSSNAKNKRPDPRTPEGEATIRSELDALESEFIQSVAKYRNKTEEYVKAEFGQGGVLMGDKAVQVGMADLISDYETTIKTLSELTKNKGENSMDAKKSITKDQIAAYRAEGAKAERERLLALEEVAVAGHENLLAKAKADPKMTAEKLALEIVKAEKAKGGKYLNGLQKAANSMPKVTPSVKPVGKVKGATPEERAKNEWASNADVRNEFNGDKAAFVAYAIAKENGQIKIQTKGE